MDRRAFLHSTVVAGGAVMIAGCATKRDTVVDVVSPGEPIGRPRPAPGSTTTRDPVHTPPAPRPATPTPATGSSHVMPRTAWTREQPRTWLANPMGRVTRITIHHDGMPPVTLRSEAEVIDRIEAIRRAHLRRGWADIGYHYVIDPMGRVWQARPRSLQGAHVKYNNEQNLGVMVLGNFMEQRPTLRATAALDRFVASNMRFFGVPLDRVYTHRELRPTACPGTHLQAHMVAARRAAGAIARLA